MLHSALKNTPMADYHTIGEWKIWEKDQLKLIRLR